MYQNGRTTEDDTDLIISTDLLDCIVYQYVAFVRFYYDYYLLLLL